MPVRITIDIIYKGEDADHTELLDSFQDSPLMEELLSPRGEAIPREHTVSVQELKKGME